MPSFEEFKFHVKVNCKTETQHTGVLWTEYTVDGSSYYFLEDMKEALGKRDTGVVFKE